MKQQKNKRRTRKCAVPECRKPFVADGNRSLYCPDCRAEQQRERCREWRKRNEGYQAYQPQPLPKRGPSIFHGRPYRVRRCSCCRVERVFILLPSNRWYCLGVAWTGEHEDQLAGADHACGRSVANDFERCEECAEWYEPKNTRHKICTERCADKRRKRQQKAWRARKKQESA